MAGFRERFTRREIGTADLSICYAFTNVIYKYCLRRGILHMHERTQDPDIRTFMMGHSNVSKMWSEYACKTSVIDFQSIFREFQQVGVTHLYFKELGRQTDSPITTSEAGFVEAKSDEEYRSLNGSSISSMESLRAKYGSLRSAANANAGATSEHDSLVARRNSRLMTGVEQIYRREYKNHFDANGYAVPAIVAPDIFPSVEERPHLDSLISPGNEDEHRRIIDDWDAVQDIEGIGDDDDSGYASSLLSAIDAALLSKSGSWKRTVTLPAM
jgi:hypothetical protein